MGSIAFPGNILLNQAENLDTQLAFLHIKYILKYEFFMFLANINEIFYSCEIYYSIQNTIVTANQQMYSLQNHQSINEK